MTSNQISYQKLVEDRRHNRAVERETKRANKENARNTRLHTEMQGSYNQAYLDHLARSLTETGRHNLATESKDLLYLTRTADENERHNRANESLTQRQIDSNYTIAMKNVGVATSQLAEGKRHNVATEVLTGQNNLYNYNLGRERNVLTGENNLYNYILGQERNRIEDLKRADSSRQHTQQQLLQMQQLKETNRHNTSTEKISDRQTTISALTNFSNQVNQWFRSIVD